MINTSNIRQIWEIARDTVGSERAYDIAPAGREKAKASADVVACFKAIRAMGEEAMQLYMTCLDILRRREMV